MKTTTKIILGLITASYLMLVIIGSIPSFEKSEITFKSNIRGTLKTQKLTAIRAFVSLDTDFTERMDYAVALVADDNAREITIDYPSQLIEVRMKGSLLDIVTSAEITQAKAEGKRFDIVEQEGEERISAEDYDTDYNSRTAVITIKLPTSALRQLLSNPKSLDLKAGILNITNYKADTFDFRRKGDLTLDGCNFQQATIDIGTHELGLIDTRIGQFTFIASEDTTNNCATRIGEGEGTVIEKLLLRTNVDITLNDSCYKHIDVDHYGMAPVSINLVNILGDRTLK